MRLRIKGREFPAVSYQNAELLHLIELQQQGKTLVDGGLGMAGLSRMQRELVAYQRAMAAHAEAVKAGECSEEPLLPDSSTVMMGVTVFLTLRKGGEQVSLVEALSVAPQDVEELPDPTDVPADQEDGQDPTMPGSAGPEMPGDAAPDLVQE